MGFLSRIFGSSRPKSNSMVVQWAEKRCNELLNDAQGDADVTPETLFPIFVYYISTFASPKSLASMKYSSFPGVDFTAHYANDSVLFEVGCYMYVLADEWLFSHRLSEREQISRALVDGFIRLFAEALQIENVADIFWHRVTKYTEIIRSGGELGERYLCLGVLRAKDNRKPDYFDIQDEPLMFLDANEHLAVTIWVGWWLSAFAPLLIECLENTT